MAFSAQKRKTILLSTLHLSALNVFVHATSRTAPWSRKLSSANLKNDYESEEINLQDSKHEYNKRDDQYSEYEDEEETYAHHEETLCNKMWPHVRLFINYALCQECNNYQQLKLSTKNARSTSNSSASASNTSVSSTKGGVLAQLQLKLYLKSSTTSTQALPQV